MAKLTCKKHGKRVFVIENNSVRNLPYAEVFHRNVSGNESVKCDSPRVVIDGDSYTPKDVLEFNTDDYVENFLADKHDSLIYS